MIVTANHEFTDSLECDRSEIGDAGVAVKVIERAERVHEAGYFMGFGAVGAPVVASDPRPVTADQFGQGEFGSPVRGRQTPTGCFPFRDDTGVLGPARCSAVFAEQQVAAAP